MAEAEVPDDANVPLEADSLDNDSAFDGSDAGSLTTSIASSVLDYKYAHGRRYHAYHEGEYPMPNDEQEQDRLDLLHHIWRLALGGALFRAPITKNPQRILDFGTGTGIWAIDIADKYPSAQVTGTDLSPIQPAWVPPNLKFTVDDAESEWLHGSGNFDFIHGRAMAGSIRHWKSLYGQCYKTLKPGGWIEMQEYETVACSDDGGLVKAESLKMFTDLLEEASRSFGKRMNVAESQKQWLEESGFKNVRDDVYKIPIGPWPKDPKLKEIGRYELIQVMEAAEAVALQLFTSVLGWKVDEVRILIAKLKQDFMNPTFHLYVNFHFVYGEKIVE